MVEQREYQGKDNQLWYLSEDPNGYYRIRSKQSNKVLDVKDQSKENGALLQIWQNDDGDNQKWSLEMVSYDTYPTINLYLYYDEENKWIEAEWNSTEDLVESELYKRCDTCKSFKKVNTKTWEEAEVEEEQGSAIGEEVIASYRENVSLNGIEESADFRVVGKTKYGKEILSPVISIRKSDENQWEEDKIDSDKDSLADGYEIWDLNSNPYEKDTDGDGFTDGYEVLELCSNPLEKTEDTDYDEDGLSNLAEMQGETNPYLPDTDLDGISDKEDAEPQKTDVNSKKEAECDFYIPTGYYDKKLCGYDEEGEYYEYIYNTLLEVYRYCQTGDDNKVYNFYDASGNQIGSVATSGGKNVINTYQYDKNGNITYITHNGFAYDFSYDENGNLTNAKVGGQQLISVDYKENTDSVQKVKYGNGDTKEYIYEETGLLATKVKVNGKTAYEYKYDGDGNLQEEKNCENGVVYSYEYDEIGDKIGINTNQDFSIGYVLDEAGEKQSISYNFEEKEKVKKIKETTTENGSCIRTTDFGTEGKSVITRDGNNTKISFQIYNSNEKAVLKQQISVTEENCLEVDSNSGRISYQYDENKNVVAIYENGEEISSYEYDFQDQLIRENNKKAGTTKLYTYDEGGNLTEEQIYSYTKEKTIQEEPKKRTTYSYNNKAWKDLLTEYNGENITYDELGNPIQYINGKQFTWVDGRKLTGIQDKENSIQYQYNSDGQRIKKVVNGQETEYNWDEEKMVFQKDKDGYLYFLYNSEDFLIGFEKNGQIYYYERNGLNDISGIYNQSGEKVVTYHYDAWGNVLAIEGDTQLGNANPFRYRSYYYDEESGFYYLLNRYYDNQVKRFLNADQFVTLQEENLLSYAKNNPLKYVDSSGNAIETIIDIFSMVWSFIELIANPSWINLGYLAWDVGSVFVPFAPGSYSLKGGKALLKVADKASDFNDARYLTIGTYNKVKKVFKGCSNIEVHHVIEKRFLQCKKMYRNGSLLTEGVMMSVPIEKGLHNVITQRWRKKFPYGFKYKNIKKYEMVDAINDVYRDMPALRRYALQYLDEVWCE